jgi:hypothetical protein
LRRCVVLDLPDPDAAKLVQIGLKHFPEGDAHRIGRIAEKLERFRETADDLRRRPPGTAEFLDDDQARAIAASLGFGLTRSPKPTPPKEIYDRQRYRRLAPAAQTPPAARAGCSSRLHPSRRRSSRRMRSPADSRR